VTETLQRLDEPGDAELISAVRGGDVSAYGTLFERHVEAARRLARQIAGTSDADDLVSDAFAKVLRVLQGGGGPDVAFRAYLLTAVRRLHVDKIRAGAKLHTTDDMDSFDPGVPFRDTAVEGFESAAAAKAFASLPERWQAVLWHTEVEGQKPAEVAVLLGMSANSVSALAYRAREGLRQAFLSSHIAELDDAECRWTHEHLGAYIRNGVSKRDGAKVEKHLDECRKCMAVYLELTEVNSNLAGILAPLLLGSAGAGYLAAASSLAAKGGIFLLLDRSKELIAANSQAAAVAGVAAAAVVVGGSVMALNGGDDSRRTADPSPIVAPDSSRTSKEPTRKPDKPTKTQSPSPTTSAAPPVAQPDETTSAAPTSEAPTSDAPTTEPPTSEPPTTEPPTTEPPPTSDLAVAPLTVETQGNLYFLTVDTSGFPAGGKAVVEVKWSRLALHKYPDRCTLSKDEDTVLCPVSASAPKVAGIEFNGKALDLIPRIRAEVTASNFDDPNADNNTREWHRLLRLLGLLI